MAARRAQSGPDLLAWPAVAAARAELAEAMAARQAAERRVRLAPPGEISIRRQRLAEAIAAELKAELGLAAVENPSGPAVRGSAPRPDAGRGGPLH